MEPRPVFPYGIILGAFGGFGLGFFGILQLSREVIATVLGVVMIAVGMAVGGFVQFWIVSIREEKRFWKERKKLYPYNQDEE